MWQQLDLTQGLRPLQGLTSPIRPGPQGKSKCHCFPCGGADLAVEWLQAHKLAQLYKESRQDAEAKFTELKGVAAAIEVRLRQGLPSKLEDALRAADERDTLRRS